MELTETDRLHLKAAQGWLELNDGGSAFDELEQIELLNRCHNDVLRIRWRIYALEKKWDSAFLLAEGLTLLLPNDVTPFIWRSYSARRSSPGGLLKAFQLLNEVADKFPHDSILHFNLACYACQLGDLDVARSRLIHSFHCAERSGHSLRVKLMALEEKDLEPLWGEIQLSSTERKTN